MDASDKPAQKRPWREPEIIEIGPAVDITTNDPQYNLRDNQGQTPVKYKVFTVMGKDEVDLDGR
jgi:hypothetical protein